MTELVLTVISNNEKHENPHDEILKWRKDLLLPIWLALHSRIHLSHFLNPSSLVVMSNTLCEHVVPALVSACSVLCFWPCSWVPVTRRYSATAPTKTCNHIRTRYNAGIISTLANFWKLRAVECPEPIQPPLQTSSVSYCANTGFSVRLSCIEPT